MTVFRRYAAQWLDGYEEGGSNADATVGDRMVGLVEAAVELEAARSYGFGLMTARIGYLARMSTGDEAVQVTMPDIENTVGFGETESDTACAGVGLDLATSASSSLALDVDAYFGGSFVGAQAMGTLAVTF